MAKVGQRHNQAFGRVLRAERLAEGVSQEQLAFDAGLDRPYISLLELGQRSPSLDTLVALCRALKVTLSELAGRIEAEMAAHSGVTTRILDQRRQEGE